MGKQQNIRTLAEKMGIYIETGDATEDMRNLKSAYDYQRKMVKYANMAEKEVTMRDFVAAHPECAEFFTGKHGREVCRVTVEHNGKAMTWCGLVTDMPRTSPHWIQSREYWEEWA